MNHPKITIKPTAPRFKEGEFGETVTVGKAADLPPAGSSPQDFPKVKSWLSNTEEGATALYKVCAHLGCLYTWREQEDKFGCPCHGSQFNLKGEYILEPAPRSLDRFVVQAINAELVEALAAPTRDTVSVYITKGLPKNNAALSQLSSAAPTPSLVFLMGSCPITMLTRSLINR